MRRGVRNIFSVARRRLAFVLRPSAFVLLLAQASCEREERGFRVTPPPAGRVQTVRLTELQPGPAQPLEATLNEYEENAYAVAEGKQLFMQMNCVGCHAHGGGGMGPPLMDARWIYGADPAQIFSTIVQGRPNGMPSFRNKLNDDQVWKLAAYVRSMSEQVQKDVAPGHSDDMSVPPELRRERKEHVPTGGIPKSGEMPR